VTGTTTFRTTNPFQEHYLNEFNATLSELSTTYLMNVESEANTISGGPLEQDYELSQFHFHTPSEHLINGQSYALELHLVHIPLAPHSIESESNQTTLSKRVVIGLFYELSDTADPILTEFLQGIISLQQSGTHSPVNWSVHLHEKLIPGIRDNDFYQYNGSLTSPPCTEDVTWFLMSKPLSVTASQLDFFANLMGQNSRPVQPLHDREVAYYVIEVPALSASSATSHALWIMGTLITLVFCVAFYYLFLYCRRDYMKIGGFQQSDSSQSESISSEPGWVAMENGVFPTYATLTKEELQYPREYDYN